MSKNPLKDKPSFEQSRANVPAWPVDPDERAELLRFALECEAGWNHAEGLRVHRQLSRGQQ